MRARLAALLLAFAAGCVNVDDPFAHESASASAVRGGLPQRLWERYALRDVGGNVLPAVYLDSGDVRYRVFADTLFFNFGTSEVQEIAVVRREDGVTDHTLTLTSPPHVAYGHVVNDSVPFPSLLFGASVGALSGATRVQPFSPNITLSGPRATFVMF